MVPDVVSVQQSADNSVIVIPIDSVRLIKVEKEGDEFIVLNM